jgi:hypothetical protein
MPELNDNIYSPDLFNTDSSEVSGEVSEFRDSRFTIHDSRGYAEIIIPLALPKNYTWAIPENLLSEQKIRGHNKKGFQ